MIALVGVLATIAPPATDALADEPLPPLARDLPRDFDAGDAEFTRRVKALFPLGSSEQFLKLELEREGFHVDDRIDLSGMHWAGFDRPGLPCRLVWYVHWRANPDGYLTAIDATYGGLCL
jgi:hypothetical protein